MLLVNLEKWVERCAESGAPFCMQRKSLRGSGKDHFSYSSKYNLEVSNMMAMIIFHEEYLFEQDRNCSDFEDDRRYDSRLHCAISFSVSNLLLLLLLLLLITENEIAKCSLLSFSN